MTTKTNGNSDSDEIQQLVRALGEAMYNDPGEKPMPMATTDATDVVHAQLTENTGTHFLDSGGHAGRHWEENQENPPWEDATYNVGRGYVTKNVAAHMERKFDRDRTAVALEAALYAFSHTDERKRDGWLSCMEAFADWMLDGYATRHELEEFGVPDEFIEDVLGVQHEMERDTGPRYTDRDVPKFVCNTYNMEFHALTQCLQAVHFGGPYAEYVMVQVHQGADVRGGYTGPRVYSVFDSWIPGEFHLSCDGCDWRNAESVAYDDENLLYQPSIDPFELIDEGWLEEDDEEHPALTDAYQANEDDHYDGAVFHRCSDVIGDFGFVRFA